MGRCLSTILNSTGTKGAATVLATVSGGTVAACCAACSAHPECQVWTLNTNDSPTKCSLKGKLLEKLRPGQDTGCTTGLQPPPPPPADNPWPVFTADEVRQCGNIRIPELTVTPSRIIIWAQCRSANTSNSAALPPFGDNMIHAKVVSKASSDLGESWTNWTVHTPVQYSHGKAIFDRVAKQVVLQYQHHPSTNPELNSSYLQRVSTDDGLSWGPERDITDQLAGCNPYRPIEMEVESAGSSIQTAAGRLIFTGHSKHNDSCTWYSDDHGATYRTSNRFVGNEISVAELAPGHLVMNGRGGSHPWNPNRTRYRSTDDGATWGPGEASVLTDNNEFGCEAALIAVNVSTGGSDTTVLFFAEPIGKSRTDLVLRCSLDGGDTWPHRRAVNGHEAAAYSAIAALPVSRGRGDSAGTELLLVWESGNTFIAQKVGIGWCVPSSSEQAVLKAAMMGP
jgi:hypothetical protein